MSSILPANVVALVDSWRGRGGPLADPSIVGTFYGTRYYDGRWHPNERGISLHVMDEQRVPSSARLLSLDLLGLDQDRRISSLRTVRELIRLLPSFLDGQIVDAAIRGLPRLVLKPDIIPVGPASQHAGELSSRKCSLWRPDGTQRSGTIAAVAQDHEGLWVLTAGHVVNPIQGDRMTEVFVMQAGEPSECAEVYSLDNENRICNIILQSGQIGGEVDMAQMKVDPSFSIHPSLGGSFGPSIPESGRMDAQFNIPSIDSVVHHYSVQRYSSGQARKEVRGAISAQSVSTVSLRAAAAKKQIISYQSVVAIRPLDGGQKFSIPGDSGSLVFDQENRPIGMIIGGSTSGNVSYMLTLYSLYERYSTAFQRFFQ